MASVRCLDNAFGFTGFGRGQAEIPQQARVIRNLIEGADLVMAHILHFYHLAAIDYLNTDVSGCVIAGQSPWSSSDHMSDQVATSADLNPIVLEYVQALNIRRKAHEFAAYLDGKHPCMPVFLPGGVTKTIPTATLGTLQTNLRDLWGNSTDPVSANTVLGFVHQAYIPTIVTVAQLFSGTLLAGPASGGLGRGCKKYLAYGTFPDSAGSMLISGGFLDATADTISSWSGYALNQNNITEYIKYSHYDDGTLVGNDYDALHPSVGVTIPLYKKPTGGSAELSAHYSWLKAPRYVTGTGIGNVHVCEVGPLARVLVDYARNVGSWQSTVNYVMSSVLGFADPTANIPHLRSVLGRHAARAIECMVVADAMSGWIGSLTATSGTGETYKHRDIPSDPKTTGYGLTEAPRGARGHGIRIDGRKGSTYQCVVPTTWNASPRDTYTKMGPIEQAINGTVVP